jgi:hypothetical protein
MEQEAAAGRGGGRKVKSLDPRIFSKATPKVQELTVDDLNKLADVANQRAQPEGAVAQLTAEDLRSLDEAFHEARLQAADMLARRLGGQGLSAEEEEIFNNWSCCCCTPCCCCAAADVDPFE